MLRLERWAESKSVSMVEVPGGDILGRRNSMGKSLKECQYGKEL